MNTSIQSFPGQLKQALNWPEIESVLGEVSGGPNGGGPYPPLVLFKALALQHCYGLSDAQCHASLADRISWRRFAGLSAADDVPDENSLRSFRARLVEQGLHTRLLGLCQRQLESQGLALKPGALDEATLAERPEIPAPHVQNSSRPPEKSDGVARRVSRKGRRVKLFFFAPYSTSGNLGQQYNAYMKLVPGDDDWVCFLDRDVMFLMADYGSQVTEIIRANPQVGLLTGLTNRIGCSAQLYNGSISEDPNILNHREIAARLQQQSRYEVDLIQAPVSGFLMILKKKVWKSVKFNENLRMLHVDWDFSKRLAAKGYSIGLMKGVYVFHYYRLKEGARDVSHLVPPGSGPVLAKT